MVGDYNAIFNVLPGIFFILKPDVPTFTILAVSDELLQVFGTERKAVVGKSIFTFFPENPETAIPTVPYTLKASLEKVIRTRQPDQIPSICYNFDNVLGEFKSRFWTASSKAVLNEKGEPVYIIHSIKDITEQIVDKERNIGILEIEYAFNHLMQVQVAIGIFKGSDFITEFINPPACEILGIGKEEIIYKPLFEVLPELKEQGFVEVFSEVLRTGNSLKAREMLVRLKKAGKTEEKYINFTLQVYRDQSGEVVGITQLLVEVTEQVINRKKIELLNRELEIARQQAKIQLQELLSLFEQAPVAIAVVKGPNYVIGIANQKVCELWGRTQEEALNKPLFELIPEAADQGFEELLDRVMKTGQPLVANEIPSQIIRYGRQETAYWNFVYYPFRDAQQVIRGVTVISTEVTEQVKARHKFEAGERRFKSLLHGIPQMTWTNLSDGSINFFSERWYGYTSLTFDQLKDWGWKQIVHPEDLHLMLAIYLKALDSGQEFIHENRLLRHDGEYRWHLNRAVPLRNGEGKIELWVGTSTEIHEQKLIAEKLQQTSRQLATTNEKLIIANEKIRASNKELADSNQTLNYINSDMDNFIYTASHDLRTPINNIEGLVEVLQKSLPAEVLQEQRVEKIIGMMKQSVSRFKNMIASLSDVVKLQKEEKVKFVKIDLESIIRDVKMDLEPIIRKSGAVFETDVSDCPYIRSTEKNVRSVIYNLISNAIKYHSPERPPHIQIYSEDNGAYAILTFKDNGIGMSQSNLDKLFGIFKRFHTHVEGTGVGLYMVKNIVKNAGGAH